MACPTCDHTMRQFTADAWWCPRCGTLRTSETSVEQPMLIGRCRRFAMTLEPAWRELWWTLGVEEAINTGRSQP